MRLLREKVTHPAEHPRELLKSFAFLVKSARPSDGTSRRSSRPGSSSRSAATASALPIAWTRRRPPADAPRGFGFVTPERPRRAARRLRVGGNLKESLHGDRVVVRVEHQQGDRVEGRVIRILERGNALRGRALRSRRVGPGFVVPFDRRLLTDVQVPPATRAMPRRARWSWPTSALAHAQPARARPHRRGARRRSRRRASTPHHHPQAQHPRRARRGGHRGGETAGRSGPRTGRPGPHRLPGRADCHDRRRARARLRRCDHASKAAERSLLAWRAHRGRRRTT